MISLSFLWSMIRALAALWLLVAARSVDRIPVGLVIVLGGLFRWLSEPLTLMRFERTTCLYYENHTISSVLTARRADLPLSYLPARGFIFPVLWKHPLQGTTDKLLLSQLIKLGGTALYLCVVEINRAENEEDYHYYDVVGIAYSL